MLYRIMNPFTPPTLTYINTDTREAWHVHENGTIEKSDREIEYWLQFVDVDRDFAMDEGL